MAPLGSRYGRIVLGLFGLLLAACGDDDFFPCHDGSCFCAPGERCAIPCAAPPCHVECVRDNELCAGECANGSCTCGPRSRCDFDCQSPPCHVRCDRGSSCRGTCENGSCTCELGASCELTCGSGPCHASCAGDNALCTAECQNGSCSCGPRSECHLTCLDHHCSASCAAGSRCTLTCPQGRAGEDGCDWDSCAAGATVCPDGTTIACGAPCPSADAGARP
jgi:hypothetical protein